MPLPTPTAGEDQNAFMGRCMRAAMEEFPRRQAVAVCMSQWRRGDNALSDEEIQDARKRVDELVAEAQSLGFDASEHQESKTEEGKQFPPGDFAYAPDPDNPSTWKLRLTDSPGGAPEARIVSAAVGALRQIPASDRSAVLRKLKAAWNQAHPDASDEDMPPVLRRMKYEDGDPAWVLEEPAIHREHGMALNGVEIFRVGTWNGDKYTEKDLDDMVAAFEDVGYRPPVKLGHSDDPGEPAYGWVEKLRRVGDRLVADFADLPESIYQAIKDRRFDAVSSEIFFNLKRNGRKFRRALKAVALLGAEIPGVAGLKPLRESFGESMSAKARAYTLEVGDLQEDDDMADEKLKELQQQLEAERAKVAQLEEAAKAKGAEDDDPLTVKALREQVDALTKAVEKSSEEKRQMRIEEKVNGLRIPALRDHFRALCDLATRDAEAVVRFKLEGDDRAKDIPGMRVIEDLIERLNKGTEKSGMFREVAHAPDLRRDDEPPENPDKDVDRLIRQRMAEKGEDYTVAMQAVFNDPRNAELMRAYANRETH